MRNIRLISRLDIKGPNLIKSINLEGIRVVGKPHDRAFEYYKDGADELIYMDMVASLYGRNNLHDVVKETTRDIFIPLTVGGGVRSVNDVEQLLNAGADKVAINTAATQQPNLISEVAQRFGSQCVVLSVEAKKQRENKWEAYVDCGRERSGRDVIEWVKQATDLGAGEVLITSIDKEGTRQGFDLELVKSVSQVSAVPVIASGGYGTASHLNDVVNTGLADAVAFADALHYDKETIKDIRSHARTYNFNVRDV